MTLEVDGHVVLEDSFEISNIGQHGDIDDHSVANFIDGCPCWPNFAEAFQNREALQKPSASASDDSDSDDSNPEYWPDIYYLKVFDTSGNELPLTSEIVADQSIKVIAYKKAIMLFSVGLFVFVLCLCCFCFRPTSSSM